MPTKEACHELSRLTGSQLRTGKWNQHHPRSPSCATFFITLNGRNGWHGPRPRYGMAGYGWWLVGRQHNGGQFVTYMSDSFYWFTLWAREEERTWKNQEMMRLIRAYRKYMKIYEAFNQQQTRAPILARSFGKDQPALQKPHIFAGLKSSINSYKPFKSYPFVSLFT